MGRPLRPARRFVLPVLALVALWAPLATSGVASSDTTTTTTVSTTTTTTTTVPPTTTTTIKPKPKHVPKFGLYPSLVLGDHAKIVATFQRHLLAEGYWVDTTNGTFDDSTQQAVYALQKTAHLPADGVVGRATWLAWYNDVRPPLRPIKGNAVEVNLKLDVILFVRNGTIAHIFNTSTGGGYTYTSDGVTSVAITPRGVYAIQREVNGLVTDSLGQLWRPKYFYEGFAIHGDSYVPSVPVSHGCVRVSNEAINWIWGTNSLPIGMKVWLYY